MHTSTLSMRNSNVSLTICTFAQIEVALARVERYWNSILTRDEARAV